MKETKEQLLMQRVFKSIQHSYFNDHKLSPYYCSRIMFPRQLGKDIANYVRVKSPEYYHKKQEEDKRWKKNNES